MTTRVRLLNEEVAWLNVWINGHQMAVLTYDSLNYIFL